MRKAALSGAAIDLRKTRPEVEEVIRDARYLYVQVQGRVPSACGDRVRKCR